jgi:hypothetical protein
MSAMGTIVMVLLFLWYVCVSVGLHFIMDYRIRTFLREQWLCWVFAFLWPVSIIGFMLLYLWDDAERGLLAILFICGLSGMAIMVNKTSGPPNISIVTPESERGSSEQDQEHRQPQPPPDGDSGCVPVCMSIVGVLAVTVARLGVTLHRVGMGLLYGGVEAGFQIIRKVKR